MNKIALTYGFDWKKTTTGQKKDIWRTLDTVMTIKKSLTKMSYDVDTIKVDDTFEQQLIKIKEKNPDTLIYWLNEFVNPKFTRSPDNFTVNIIEHVGLPHTGPSSKTLALGLNKFQTKQLFTELGIKTPDSYIVNFDNLNSIYEYSWDFPVIVKPLLHGDSLGINKKSVVNGDDYQEISSLVTAIHRKFKEPAIVEQYIGGETVRELTLSVLIDHQGGILNLPFVEIDFTKISFDQKFKFLHHTLKKEIMPIKILSALSNNYTINICRECNEIIKKMNCVDFARLDVRINESDRFYIEVNAFPAKNKGSYIARAAHTLGIKNKELFGFSLYNTLLKYDLTVTSQLKHLVEPILNAFKLQTEFKIAKKLKI